MSLNFPRKIISPIFCGLISTLLFAGISTPVLADSKSAVKDEMKAGEIKPADAMTKAPTDADFKRLDNNGDSKISLKEAVKDKALAAQFDATDVNHDGMISADEYANYKTASAIKGTEPSAVTPVTN